MSSIRNFCQILIKLEFASLIFENTQISYSLRIYVVGAKLFHVDRQTHTHDEANSCSLEFCKYA
jgi:hypothetical protein